jgi:DNA-binding NtrC family response regulator
VARPAAILVVDDNHDALESVAAEMRSAGYQVRTARDGRAGWEQFRSQRPDLVISDIRMPHENGIVLLQRIREVSDAPVILLTAHADVSVAVSALREGATDFVRFPEEVGELLGRVQELLPARLAPEAEDAASKRLAGDAPGMRELRSRVRALAALDVPVLISGEPGTGRMATALAIHELSRNPLPLVAVSGPGYEVPSERCAVVLVELESWPIQAQERWSHELRAADGDRFARVYTIGGPSLAECVERAEVRRDLWLRTARFRVDVPPLRARALDIPRIAREELAQISEALGRGGYSFTAGALDALGRRPWRANLAELREVLEQAVAFADGVRLDRDAIDRAVDAVIAAREDSLANRRAAKQSADREQLVRLLGSCRGNVAEVARQLGMTRGAVTYRLRKHGLTR